MAVVPGYLNDVFISYVRDDDTAAGGLVAAFQKELTIQLKAAGLKKYEPEIFFDTSDALTGEDVARQFMSHARLSAVFIAFWSPNYLDSLYCTKEWGAFTQSSQALNGRLFIGELEHGIRERAARELGCPYPPLTVPFHYESGGKHYTMTPPGRNESGKDLHTIAIDMAREVKTQLLEMRRLMLDATPRVPRVALLAPQALAEFSDKIATACCQSGVLTLDAVGLNALRQRTGAAGPNFADEWLRGADVIADLIDPAVPDAPVPVDLPAGKVRLRWLRRDHSSAAASAAVAELRKDPAVRECAQGEFLEELKRTAQMETRRGAVAATAPAPAPVTSVAAGIPAAPPAAVGPAGAHVIIVTWSGDAPKVMPLQDFLEKNGISSDVSEEADAAEGGALTGAALQAVAQHTVRIKELLELFAPAAVVFVDGSGPAAWIDNRLRSWRLLRRPDLPEIRCVEIAPLPKADRRCRLPATSYLDITDPHELQAFIQSL